MLDDFLIDDTTLNHEDIVSGKFSVLVEGGYLQVVLPISGYTYDEILSDKGNAERAAQEFLEKNDIGAALKSLLYSTDEYPVLSADQVDEFRQAHELFRYIVAQDDNPAGYIAAPTRLVPELLSKGWITIDSPTFSAGNTLYVAQAGYDASSAPSCDSCHGSNDHTESSDKSKIDMDKIYTDLNDLIDSTLKDLSHRSHDQSDKGYGDLFSAMFKF